MWGKEKRCRVVIEGMEEYLSSVKVIQAEAEKATKSITQLNEALKELTELRKRTLL